MRAVFQLNISRDWSGPVAGVTAGNRKKFDVILEQALAAGDISGADPRLLAEHMVAYEVILMENWAAGVISLPSFQRNTLYHFYTLLFPWASRPLLKTLRPALEQLQQELVNEN